MDCVSPNMVPMMDSNAAAMPPTNNEGHFYGACRVTNRSWSGNLVRPPRKNKTNRPSILGKNSENDHRRTESVGAVEMDGTDDLPCSPGFEPKLVRSGGMRRDWSFEDVRARIKHKT